MSRHMADPANKATLIIMAQAWLTLADQTAKYGETLLVDETPSPRTEALQQVAQQQQQPQPDDPDKKQND